MIIDTVYKWTEIDATHSVKITTKLYPSNYLCVCVCVCVCNEKIEAAAAAAPCILVVWCTRVLTHKHTQSLPKLNNTLNLTQTNAKRWWLVNLLDSMCVVSTIVALDGVHYTILARFTYEMCWNVHSVFNCPLVFFFFLKFFLFCRSPSLSFSRSFRQV